MVPQPSRAKASLPSLSDDELTIPSSFPTTTTSSTDTSSSSSSADSPAIVPAPPPTPRSLSVMVTGREDFLCATFALLDYPFSGGPIWRTVDPTSSDSDREYGWLYRGPATEWRIITAPIPRTEMSVPDAVYKGYGFVAGFGHGLALPTLEEKWDVYNILDKDWSVNDVMIEVLQDDGGCLLPPRQRPTNDDDYYYHHHHPAPIIRSSSHIVRSSTGGGQLLDNAQQSVRVQDAMVTPACVFPDPGGGGGGGGGREQRQQHPSTGRSSVDSDDDNPPPSHSPDRSSSPSPYPQCFSTYRLPSTLSHLSESREVARELAFMKQLSNVSEHTGEPFPGCSSVLTLYHNPDGDNHDGGQGGAAVYSFAALMRRSERLCLRTDGDGDCLLHSLSLSMWGFHSRKLDHEDKDPMRVLMSNLMTSIQFQQHAIPRYQVEQKAANQNLPEGFGIDDEGAETEFRQLVVQAAVSRVYLAALHVYAISQVLRRPIVVYENDPITTDENSGWKMGGVYLPDYARDVLGLKTCRSPLTLLYTGKGAAGHFSALVYKMGQEEADGGCPVAPLCDHLTGRPLPLRFVRAGGGDNDIPLSDLQTTTLLATYMDFENGSGRQALVPGVPDVVAGGHGAGARAQAPPSSESERRNDDDGDNARAAVAVSDTPSPEPWLFPPALLVREHDMLVRLNPSRSRAVVPTAGSAAMSDVIMADVVPADILSAFRTDIVVCESSVEASVVAVNKNGDGDAAGMPKQKRYEYDSDEVYYSAAPASNVVAVEPSSPPSAKHSDLRKSYNAALYENPLYKDDRAAGVSAAADGAASKRTAQQPQAEPKFDGFYADANSGYNSDGFDDADMRLAIEESEREAQAQEKAHEAAKRALERSLSYEGERDGSSSAAAGTSEEKGNRGAAVADRGAKNGSELGFKQTTKQSDWDEL